MGRLDEAIAMYAIELEKTGDRSWLCDGRREGAVDGIAANVSRFDDKIDNLEPVL